MPRSGGVYSKPAGTTAVAGTTIESADFNTLMDDIVTDLNTARPITAGGTGATSAAGARTALSVPGLSASSTISGTWTISGAWTFSAGVTFQDGFRTYWGTGQDLSAHHNGTNSFIDNATGTLFQRSLVGVVLQNVDGTENLATFTVGGAVTLLYDNATKLATSNTGVSITGNAVASGNVTGVDFTASGAVSGATMAGAMLQDDDTFATPAANKVPSSESTKAYVTSRIAGYTATAQTITAGGLLSLTHGLGTTPTEISIWLACTTAEHGYSIGDRVFIGPGFNAHTADNQGVSVVPTSTQLLVRFGSYGAGVFWYLHKSTGDRVALTDASWTFNVKAR